MIFACTAIPYRVSSGPEQGFPCVLFPHREKPVFITGFTGDENRVCYSSSVFISLQPHLVKISPIRPNLPSFSRPKVFICTFETSFFPDFHSNINKQGYSGGTSSDIVTLV